MRSLLAIPGLYSFFACIIGGNDARRYFVREHVRPRPNDRVLDIGCGPADILNFLPKVDYTGFDASADYIDAARRKFGARGRFFSSTVSSVSLETKDFDLVIVIGVLHHLDDTKALKLIELAHSALRQGGRLITIDGCYAPRQSVIARFFLDHDRGQHVRDQYGYEGLARKYFGNVTSTVRSDLLNIPYTHVILECIK